MQYESHPIITEVAPLLSAPIPDDVEGHIIELDAIRFELAKATREMLQLLYEKRKQLLFPRDMPGQKMTELDRQTKLNSDTAPIQKDYELLLRIEDIIDSRIDICMKLL